jgi:hypothetical protein
MKIDLFKITVPIIQTKIKRTIVNFLILIISKLDNNFLISCTIDTEYKVKFKRYVPQDGEWHHFSHTVECWIKFNEEVKNEKIYIDGKLKKRIK